VLNDFIRLADENMLNGLEKPKQITLLTESFTPDNGLLTPTMKLKRAFAKEHFKEKIASMYEMDPMRPKKKK